MPNSWKDVLQDNEDVGRRDLMKAGGGAAAGTALAVDTLDDDDNMYTRIAGALDTAYQRVFVDPVADELESRRDSDGQTPTDTSNETDSTPETDTGKQTEKPHWTVNYDGADFSGDLVGMGQSQANATADLFEMAYSDSRGIFDVSLQDSKEVNEDHLTREWNDYNDSFLKVNDVAFPLHDGSPNTGTLEGLGYEESFVEDTLEPLDDEDELTRVGEEYAEEVLNY